MEAIVWLLLRIASLGLGLCHSISLPSPVAVICILGSLWEAGTVSENVCFHSSPTLEIHLNLQLPPLLVADIGEQSAKVQRPPWAFRLRSETPLSRRWSAGSWKASTLCARGQNPPLHCCSGRPHCSEPPNAVGRSAASWVVGILDSVPNFACDSVFGPRANNNWF